VCQQPVPAGHPQSPFCSERCKLIDLGHWLGGDYRVAGADEDDGDAAATPAEAPED
jgi:endogenous inhibitor of DNA gyrase (YacG/DUF329 family)